MKYIKNYPALQLFEAIKNNQTKCFSANQAITSNKEMVRIITQERNAKSMRNLVK